MQPDFFLSAPFVNFSNGYDRLIALNSIVYLLISISNSLELFY